MTTEQKEIMQHNTRLVLPHIAPIIVYNRGETKAFNWKTGGTGFFVNTGVAKLFVTAAHVKIEIDRLSRASDIDIVIAVIDEEIVTINNWEVMICDRDVDICVFKVPDNFNLDSIGKRFHTPDSWPPRRAENGEPTFVLGFPAEKRTATNKRITCGTAAIAEIVSNLGPTTFMLTDDEGSRIAYSNYTKLANITCFGGMSGAPIFGFRREVVMESIGIFIEGGDGVHAPFWGVHTDLISGNGELNQAMIPPR